MTTKILALKIVANIIVSFTSFVVFIQLLSIGKMEPYVSCILAFLTFIGLVAPHAVQDREDISEKEKVDEGG